VLRIFSTVVWIVLTSLPYMLGLIIDFRVHLNVETTSFGDEHEL